MLATSQYGRKYGRGHLGPACGFHGTLPRKVTVPRNASESSQQSGAPRIRPQNSGVLLSVRICTHALAAVGYWAGNWRFAAQFRTFPVVRGPIWWLRDEIRIWAPPEFRGVVPRNSGRRTRCCLTYLRP